MIVPATLSHVEFVATYLRPEDKDEVEKATGRAPRESLPLSFSQSKETFVALSGPSRVPIAIFGVEDDTHHPGWGICWFLSVPLSLGESKAILRLTPAWLDTWQASYHYGLHNLMYAGNTTHLRWCLRNGFEFGSTYNHRGHPFLHFYRRKVG